MSNLTTNSSPSSFDGDDFSNNLFTDLGPLLSLFGAEVTTQFMSQSLTWADHLIFAIGPLGVITAMVSAIRVGGPYSLRAFIGRAREPRAEIERQMMSSTSKEVCEMWNGESLVRVTGNPKMAELLVVFDNSSSSGPQLAVECKENSQFVQHNPRTSGIQNSPKAPNISLNHPPSRSAAETVLFSVIAIILQSVVLLLDAFVTYRWQLPKQGQRVSQAAFPLVFSGTVALTAGMFLCSEVVSMSTRQEWYYLKKGSPIKLLWLQKKGVVADQNFESYAIFAAEGRQAVVASTREEFLRQEDAQPKMDSQLENGAHMDDTPLERLTVKMLSINFVTIVGIFLSLAGYVVQFVGIRQMHWLAGILQLILSVTMTAIRSWVRRDLSRQPDTQKLHDGHEMDWLATRQKLYGPDNDGTPHASAGFSSLTRSPDKITPSPQKFLRRISNFLRGQVIWERERPQPWYADRYQWFIVDSHIANVKMTNIGNQNAVGENIPKKNERLNRAHAVLTARERIKNLIAWQSPVEEAAASLVCAIDAVIKHTSDEDMFKSSFESAEEFVWGLKVGEAKEVVQLRVSMKNGSKITVEPSVEAALSLWVYELSFAEADLTKRLKRNYTIKNIWRIGPNNDALRRDCAWWVFKRNNPQYIGFQNENESSLVPQMRYFKDRPGWPDELQTDPSIISREFGPGITLEHSQESEKGMETLSVALNSGYGMPQMCAWHLFAVFMHCVSKCIEEVKGTTSFDTRTENTTSWSRSSVKLTNSSLHSLATAIEASKLCNLEEAYMSIVPPLCMAGKLPMPHAVIDYGLKAARSLEKQKNWIAAKDIYVQLLQMCRSFGPEGEMLGKAVAVSAEFLSLLNDAEEVYRVRADTGGIVEILQVRSMMEKEIQCSDSKLLRSLRALYRWQREIREVQGLRLSHSSVPLKPLDLGKIRQDSSQTRIWAWNYLFLDVAANDPQELVEHLENAEDQRLALQAQDILGWSPLHYAAQIVMERREEQNKCLLSLLKKGLDPNCSNILGLTPLHCAVKSEVKSSIDTLIQYGAQIDSRTVNGKTALHIAARSRDSEVASTLCEKGADIEARDSFEQTPLHVAALTGSVKVMSLLLDWKAKPRVREESGLTPLHAICGQTRTTANIADVVDRLLQEGAALEARDRSGQTPLHFAARSGCSEALEVLLGTRGNGRSADIQACDTAGMNPFHVAAKYCQMTSARMLLQKSKDYTTMISSQDGNGRTPLHHAVAGTNTSTSNRAEFVSFLLKHGASFNAKDGDGMTPLHLCKDQEVFNLLVGSGADIHAKDQRGRKPLHTARDPNVIRELLKKLGADRYKNMNLIRDEKGMTPLHSVLQSGDNSAMKAHLEDGAPVDAKDSEGRTPLHLAVQIKNIDLSPLRLLLEYRASLDAVDNDDKTVLELVVESKMSGAVNMLLQEYRNRGIKIRSRTLHIAAKSGDRDLMEILLSEAPEFINSKDDEDMTLLHLAVEWGNMAVADLLVERGADIKATDSKGRTPDALIRTPETRKQALQRWSRLQKGKTTDGEQSDPHSKLDKA